MSSAYESNEAVGNPGLPPASAAGQSKPASPAPAPREIGGRGGLDPVRYGDWEKDGRCIDF